MTMTERQKREFNRGNEQSERRAILTACLAASAFILFILVGTAVSWGGSRCYWIGNNQYCQGDDGSRSTGYSIGGFDYYNGTNSDGTTWRQSCYYIGDSYHCN